MVALDRVRGSLFGAALGDALGAQTEFVRSASAILAKWPPDGPQEPARGRGGVYLVTDDTQMMLAVGEGLERLLALDGVAAVQEAAPEVFREVFVAWFHDPQNNRAPGNTCMGACGALDRAGSAAQWVGCTVIGSKGCGGNMRVQPVGLLDPSRFGVADRAGLAQLQCAMTHGHPTALAASDLTAHAVHLLATDAVGARELPEALLEYARAQRTTYHARWLGALWERTPERNFEDYIARGWDECVEALARVVRALVSPDRSADPCLAAGEGWIAEEALAAGLLCFALYPDDPHAAIRRAAISRGDSDSIACIAGALAGAAHGMAAWRPEWVQNVEYRERLEAIAAALAT